MRSTHRSAASLIALAVLATTGIADARPKRRDSKAAFDRGLAAYKKGSFAAASEALGKSFELERDVDTLFAWAQAERKLERCAKAIELYETLLGFDLPGPNREAVERSIADCRTVLAAQPTPPPLPPAAEPPPPQVAPRVELSPVEPPPTVVATPPIAEAPAPRAWYRDPIALGLMGTGVIATGVGAALLVSARSLDSDYHNAPNVDAARPLADKAKTRGTIGVVTLGAGGAVLAGGVAWILLHRGSAEQRTVTGWLAPGGGGVAVAGAF